MLHEHGPLPPMEELRLESMVMEAHRADMERAMADDPTRPMESDPVLDFELTEEELATLDVV